eukprot:5088177-Prymnesium_polylepis.1
MGEIDDAGCAELGQVRDKPSTPTATYSQRTSLAWCSVCPGMTDWTLTVRSKVRPVALSPLHVAIHLGSREERTVTLSSAVR